MKKRFVLISLQVLVVLLSSCTSTKVVSDLNEVYDFNSVKTFSLTYAEAKSTQKVNDLNKVRLEKSIVREMESRGLQLVKENPDVSVQYYTKLELERDIYASGSAYGNGYGRGAYRNMSAYGSKSASIETTKNGFVVIEMNDYKDDEMVWYSYGEREITSSMVNEKASKEINQMVEKIIDTLPIEKQLANKTN